VTSAATGETKTGVEVTDRKTQLTTKLRKRRERIILELEGKKERKIEKKEEN
jgi:hypothetical protein